MYQFGKFIKENNYVAKGIIIEMKIRHSFFNYSSDMFITNYLIALDFFVVDNINDCYF